MTENNFKIYSDFASEIATEAGHVLFNLFGKQLKTKYKDKNKTDPVSEADIESQSLLTKRIKRKFPDHGILGEETLENEKAETAIKNMPDYLWILDPLDGTKNFLNGISIWGCSVGLLFKGEPVAGAIFLPEVTKKNDFVIYKASLGEGAFLGDQEIRVTTDEKPSAKKTISVPGSFANQFKTLGSLKNNLGEIRTTGSISYDLAMVARGSLHYALFGVPSIWDVAAGIIILKEAGGSALQQKSIFRKWEPLHNFINTNETDKKMENLRNWKLPVIVGNSSICEYISSRIKKISRKRKS
tara:strand:- start:1773 stop:2669 length:897 start_codon:yes stop_codon:yes gene_type:complete